jgi:hypothetical protein
MQNTAEKQEETPLHRFTSSSIYAEDDVEKTVRSRKRLVVAALAIGAFVSLLVFSYNKSRQSGGESVVATVEPKTPYTRIRPDNPEGAEAPYKEMEVYNRTSGTPDATAKTEKLAPLPEQPIVKTLEKPRSADEEPRSLVDIANTNEERAINSVVSPSTSPSKNVEEAKSVLQNAYQQKADSVAVPLNIKTKTEESMTTTADSAKAVVEESAPIDDNAADKTPAVLTQPRKTIKPTKPVVVAPKEENAVAAKPLQKVVVKRIEQTQRPAEKTVKNIVKEIAKEPVSTKTATVATASPVAAGLRVQLGAFSSEVLAKNAWKTLSSKNSAVLGSLNPHIVPVQANGKTLYRLQAGVLANRTLADTVCTKLKTTNQTCIVAK